jgi:hypothetical protein
MPFKANTTRRHHIPRQKRKVINWGVVQTRVTRKGALALPGRLMAR